MAKGFIPARDAAFLAWCQNFSAYLSTGAASVGITPAQQMAFADLIPPYSDALATATNPGTRTRGAIAARDACREPLEAMARELARIINAFPATTNQQRLDLGLTPRTGQYTPIQPPTEPPVMEVIAAQGRSLKVRLHAMDSTRRGRPDGVSGASLFSYVGDAPPADITQWVFQGSTSRTSFDIEFPPTVPAGSQVFLCAFWYNPRAESGPACTPISAYLAGGVVAAQREAA